MSTSALCRTGLVLSTSYGLWYRLYYSDKKAAGQEGTRADNITADEIKASTEESGLLIVQQLLTRIWEEEIFPEEWKQANIVLIYKKKDKLVCNNYSVSAYLVITAKSVSQCLWKGSRKERRKSYRKNRQVSDHRRAP